MSRPDLSTDEGVAAYRAELKGVARPYRMAGFILILLGAAWVMATRFGYVAPQQALMVIAYGMVAAGWGLFLIAIVLRTRYHKRRLAEGL